ncbi:MarR family winged helix-turn-helix transcriptional regulator [Bacillus sp. NPDC060175]|uniref:MarR family winged helix-turn-helix transcriptional regulator n=1 Tax=Bacillus sp. NPDC060175 TaxID=3347061 RepID=UPI003663F733
MIPQESAVSYLFTRMYFLIKKKSNHALNKYGLTPEQFIILHHLFEHEGISQKELAGLEDKDQTSVGKTLERLENKEYIIRKSSHEDKRVILLFLSPTGRDIYFEALPVMQDVSRSIVDVLPPAEAKQFVHLLNEVFSKHSR